MQVSAIELIKSRAMHAGVFFYWHVFLRHAKRLPQNSFCLRCQLINAASMFWLWHKLFSLRNDEKNIWGFQVWENFEVWFPAEKWQFLIQSIM